MARTFRKRDMETGESILDEKEIYYVYGHYYPGTDMPYGIGKGKGYRATDTRRRNLFWLRTIKKYGVDIRMLYENICEVDALLLEILHIGIIGRRDKGKGPLLNMTDGGEGMSGHVPSEYTRNKRSISCMGKNVGNKAWNKNRKHPKETRQKIKDKRKFQIISAESNAKRSKTLKNRIFDDSHKEKLRIRAKERIARGDVPMKGSKWFHNDSLRENKLFLINVAIPNGWFIGRIGLKKRY
jgi:hypothetical protein